MTVGVLVAVLVGGFILARTETLVGAKGFLESMIPHHSRALLVCESKLTDPEITQLCGNIIASQAHILERY